MKLALLGTGTNYYAWKMGPVPEKDKFNEIIEKLTRDWKNKGR